MDLFDPEEGEAKKANAAINPGAPLADRMRPRTLDEFVGQQEVVGPGAPLRRLIEEDTLRSIIFWGPPGTGKTTLAAIIAHQTRSRFTSLSAVTSSIKDVKALMEEARASRRQHARPMILFIDEIHRFNKAQQDAFLPFVEEGSIVLIGATTENPSFSVISALLSRCRVFVLKALTAEDLLVILRRALADRERGVAAENVTASETIIEQIAGLSDGDARRALNLLEFAVQTAEPNASRERVLDEQVLKQVLQRQHLIYDKSGEEHYNLISALHKSLRGSDVQASIYWAQRILKSGEDPLYLARRMIRFASEDIGNADPQALSIALAAREAYSVLGTPEGELALLQCVIYLATAPKSNSVYEAAGQVAAEIEISGSLPAPLHIRNAPTGLMKQLGYGKDYAYDHAYEAHFSGQEHLPEGVKNRVYYTPGEFGFERDITKRMEYWEKRRAELKAQREGPQQRERKPPQKKD